MKKILLSLTALLLFSTAAGAADKSIDPAEIKHRTKIQQIYHYGVYYPVFVGTFLVGGIPILVHHANVRLDESIKEWATVE